LLAAPVSVAAAPGLSWPRFSGWPSGLGPRSRAGRLSSVLRRYPQTTAPGQVVKATAAMLDVWGGGS